MVTVIARPETTMTIGPRSLHRLVYRSRLSPEAAADLEYQLRDILSSSITNNRRDGVSGLLVTVQGCFIQALEGSLNAVQNAFGRISRDPRHSETVVIAAGPAEARLFQDWDMCAHMLSPADAAIVKVIDARGVFDPTRLTPTTALRLLAAVADIQRRTALSSLVA